MAVKARKEKGQFFFKDKVLLRKLMIIAEVCRCEINMKNLGNLLTACVLLFS